jgi:periplasmic divalent cation tolerance protein
MIIKTREALASAVMEAVKSRHPYANPALVVLPIVDGSAEYLSWLSSQTQAQSD